MELTEQEIQKYKSEIDLFGHRELAKIYRFATGSHVYFANDELNKYFMSRFNSFGGWTSKISKEIGW